MAADEVLVELEGRLAEVKSAIRQQISENAQAVEFEGRRIARVDLTVLRAEENRLQEAVNRRRVAAAGGDYDWGRHVRIERV